MSTSKIRVAISGGGVAGASLLHALQPYPHLDVDIFESAPVFREAGVTFGITQNADNAITLIGQRARDCVERAGGVQSVGATAFVGQGDCAGEEIVKVVPGAIVVQRANILREFLADARPGQLHASKKLTSVERLDDCIRMHFLDGSTHDCDILVGADGVHSTVRKLILGADDPAATPRKSPWWAIMTLHPYEKARASIGSASIDLEEAHEYAWTGKNALMMSNILTNGDVVQFTIISRDELPLENEKDASNQWSRTVTPETLKKLYVDNKWSSHLDKAVLELLCEQPSQQAISIWEHLHAHTYVSGAVCLLGDAAHATTPFQAAGGGMCIEDTMILSTLLGRISSPAEARVALKVYDQVRRERTQHVVESSFETGLLLTGSHQVAGLDPVELRERLANRWDFIQFLDMTKHRDDAIKVLDEELGRATTSEAANGVSAGSDEGATL